MTARRPRTTLVERAYTDAFGRRRSVSPDAVAAIHAAMGLGPGERPSDDVRVTVARRGDALRPGGELTLEDGTSLGRVGSVPRDLPHGYHRLHRRGRDELLIVGPGRCHLPPGLRAWGWAVQLPTLRSERSWGIGDLADLRELASWSERRGAGFVATSPLGASNPGPDPEPSPYYPSTRRFLSPLHLSLDEVPGVAALGDEVAPTGRSLNRSRVIDRAAILRLKLAALERVWSSGAADRDALQQYRNERGTPLDRWATFVVLTERLGPGWRGWPARYRDPGGPAVASVAAEAGDRVAFHAWIQLLLDTQLEAASAPLRRIADMPVGVDPGGFDAWDWQEQLATGATVGAPPDRFNAAGQDWGLPPFVPYRLRAAAYRPFIETIRAQLRHAGGLRIDHVLGLFRLWWIPAGSDPGVGAYVRYPTDELLEIVAIESERAGAVVIGEDLGTVPPGVRSELRRRRVLSTRLALFERRPPARYPRQAFAAVTTHDLPTIAGAWTRSDLHDQVRAGLAPDRAGLEHLRRSLARSAGVGDDAALDEVVDAVHRRLAESPSMLVAATLEDALRVETRPNLPGTVARQRHNWSLPLPKTLERLFADRRVRALADALRR